MCPSLFCMILALCIGSMHTNPFTLVLECDDSFDIKGSMIGMDDFSIISRACCQEIKLYLTAEVMEEKCVITVTKEGENYPSSAQYPDREVIHASDCHAAAAHCYGKYKPSSLDLEMPNHFEEEDPETIHENSTVAIAENDTLEFLGKPEIQIHMLNPEDLESQDRMAKTRKAIRAQSRANANLEKRRIEAERILRETQRLADEYRVAREAMEASMAENKMMEARLEEDRIRKNEEEKALEESEMFIQNTVIEVFEEQQGQDISVLSLCKKDEVETSRMRGSTAPASGTKPVVLDINESTLCLFLVQVDDCYAIDGIDDSAAVKKEIREFCEFPPAYSTDNEVSIVKQEQCKDESFRHTSCGVAIAGNHYTIRGRPVSSRRMPIFIGNQQVNMKIQISCIDICLSEPCAVIIKGSKKGVSVGFSSVQGYYHVAMNDEIKEGFFKNGRDIEFDYGGDGLKVVHGYCNISPFSRKVMLSTGEYCNSKYPGKMNLASNVYCKHYSAINGSIIAILILVILYFMREAFACAIGFIVSLMGLTMSYLFFWKFYCKKCMSIKFRKTHHCRPTACPYCFEEVKLQPGHGDDMIKRKYDQHFKECSKAKSNMVWYICFRITYLSSYNFLTKFFSLIPRLSIGTVAIIILIFVVQPSEANETFVDKVSSIVFQRYVEKIASEGSINKIIDETRNLRSEMKERLQCQKEKMFFSGMSCFVLAVFSFSLWVAAKQIVKMIYFLKTSLSYRRICPRCMELVNENHNDDICGNIWCPVCKVTIGSNGLHPIYEQRNAFHITHVEHHEINRKETYEMRESIKIRSSIGLITKVMVYLLIIFSLIGTSFCHNKNHNSEMRKVEQDLEKTIKDLTNEGFHPYHARFTGGAREHISAVTEKKSCSHGKCRVQMEIEADMRVRPGKEFGYIVKGENIKTELKMNIKIRNPKSICQYKEQYKTGKVLHSSVSGDTCTDSCGQCLNEIRKSAEKENAYKTSEKYTKEHPDSSSWSCDGPWCASMGSGCTCLECWCHVDIADWEIKSLVSERHQFEICMLVGGKGYCKTVEEEERGKVLTVLEYGKSDGKCPEIIACKGMACYKGDINKVDEFHYKFGAVKLIGGKTTSRPQIEASEICHFGKNRYYHMEKCCIDTYHMKETLKPSNLIMNQKEKNKMEKAVQNLGSWKIRLTMPALIFNEKVDDLKVEGGRITSCKGCHSCSEGGSCLIEFNSNFEHGYELSCSECTTDVSHVFASRGANSIPFSVFCKKEKGELNCLMGRKFNVKGEFSLLDEPVVPHGDGIANVDLEKTVTSECTGVFCGFGLQFMDIYSRIKYVIITIILITVVISVFFLIKFLIK